MIWSRCNNPISQIVIKPMKTWMSWPFLCLFSHGFYPTGKKSQCVYHMENRQRLYWMHLINERWWQHLHRQQCLTGCCPVLIFWSLQSGNILAGTETAFQPIYLEFLPKTRVRKKGKSGEQLWRSCSVLEPQFRYIPVSDCKILLDLKFRWKMLKHLVERGKKKTFWEGKVKLLSFTFCH